MTNNEELCSMQVIEFCRDFNRRMAAQQASIGARPEDIAIASIYSALDIAQCFLGDDTLAAIEWARSAIDAMDTSLQPTGSLQ